MKGSFHQRYKGISSFHLNSCWRELSKQRTNKDMHRYPTVNPMRFYFANMKCSHEDWWKCSQLIRIGSEASSFIQKNLVAVTFMLVICVLNMQNTVAAQAWFYVLINFRFNWVAILDFCPKKGSLCILQSTQGSKWVV